MIQLMSSYTIPCPIASLRSVILFNSRLVILLRWAYHSEAIVFGSTFLIPFLEYITILLWSVYK